MGIKAIAITLKALVMILILLGSSSAFASAPSLPFSANNLSAVLEAPSSLPELTALILAILVLIQLFSSVFAKVSIPNVTGPSIVESLSTSVGPPMVPFSLAMAASSNPRSARMAVLALNCCASSGEGDHQGKTSEVKGEVGSSAD